MRVSNIYPVSATFKPSAIPFEEKLLQDNTQLRPVCMKNQEKWVRGRSLSDICRGEAVPAQSMCNCGQSALRLCKQVIRLTLQSEIWAPEDDALMYGPLQLMEDEVNWTPIFVMSMFRRFMMIYVPSVCSHSYTTALALTVWGVCWCSSANTISSLPSSAVYIHARASVLCSRALNSLLALTFNGTIYITLYFSFYW